MPEHRAHVEAVDAHVRGRAARGERHGARAEAADEGVAAAHAEVRVDAPDADVKRRLAVELPEVEVRELQVARAHADA